MGRIKLKPPKNQALTSDRLVRLWRVAGASDEADQKFTDAVVDLFHAARLGPDRVETLLRRLGPDGDISGLMQQLIHLATDIFGASPTTDNDLVMWQTQLFAIPIYGNVAAAPGIVSGAINQVTQSIRISGFSPDQSNVIVHPRLLCLEDLIHLDPQTLFDLTDTASMVLQMPPGTPEAAEVRDDFDAFFPEEVEAPPQPTVGQRFLVGARFIPFDQEDADTENDGLTLQAYAATPEEEGLVLAMAEKWRAMMRDIVTDPSVRIDNPVPWTRLVPVLLAARADLDISASLSFEGLDPSLEIDKLLAALGDESVQFSAMRGGKCLTHFAFPFEVVFPYIKELLVELGLNYPLELLEDAADLPRPVMAA